jgi:hypothetical protein
VRQGKVVVVFWISIHPLVEEERVARVFLHVSGTREGGTRWRNSLSSCRVRDSTTLYGLSYSPGRPPHLMSVVLVQNDLLWFLLTLYGSRVELYRKAFAERDSRPMTASAGEMARPIELSILREGS